MAIPSKAQREQWRKDMTAFTDYTPAEFTFLLNAMDELEAQRDALLELCGKLARIDTGTAAGAQADWIANILDLAAEARATLTIVEAAP